MAAPAQEQRIGEAHLYTVPGKVTLRPGQTSIVALFEPVVRAGGEAPRGPVGAPVLRRPPAVRRRAGGAGRGDVHRDPRAQDAVRRHAAPGRRAPASTRRTTPGGCSSSGRRRSGTPPPGSRWSSTPARRSTSRPSGRRPTYTSAREKNGRYTATADYSVSLANATDSAATVDVYEERGGDWSVLPELDPRRSGVEHAGAVPGRGAGQGRGHADLPDQGRPGERVTLVHLSDLHFGRPVDLAQIRAVERLVPALAPDAVVVSGDISQRGRHGEYQRGLAFLERMQETAPTLLVPGNHDVRMVEEPLPDLSAAERSTPSTGKYFGEELTPVLRLPGLVVAGALSAHGLAFGSMTWNQRDLTVKGHLPTVGDGPARRALRRGAARHGAGGGAAPQRAPRRHLAAHGPGALDQRAAAARRHRRPRGALRARSPGGGGAARRAAP